jgi:hypothetical protein
MTSSEPRDDITILYDALMPALSQASIGNFESDIEIDPANSERVNELLMGVEVLLEVIRETVQNVQSSDESSMRNLNRVQLLDDVLKKPAA